MFLRLSAAAFVLSLSFANAGEGYERMEDDYFTYSAPDLNLTGYSIGFESCIPGAGVVFHAKKSNHPPARYLVGFSEYFGVMSPYQKRLVRTTCDACRPSCDKEHLSFGLDCSTCQGFCDKVDGMNEHGVVHASRYSQCQPRFDPSQATAGNAGNMGMRAYIGPYCEQPGDEIKIGVFKDNLCKQPDPEKILENFFVDLDNYGVAHPKKLNYILLKSAQSKTTMVSCQSVDCNQIANAVTARCDDSDQSGCELISSSINGLKLDEEKHENSNYALVLKFISCIAAAVTCCSIGALFATIWFHNKQKNRVASIYGAIKVDDVNEGDDDTLSSDP